MINLETHIKAIMIADDSTRSEALEWIADDPEGLFIDEYREEAREALKDVSKMRTLLIDDLRNINATVIARTFDEGIKALKTERFDILYLDHDLADIDDRKTGYGIMNFLEENRHLLPTKIVLVTANPVGRVKMQVVIDLLYKGNV